MADPVVMDVDPAKTNGSGTTHKEEEVNVEEENGQPQNKKKFNWGGLVAFGITVLLGTSIVLFLSMILNMRSDVKNIKAELADDRLATIEYDVNRAITIANSADTASAYAYELANKANSKADSALGIASAADVRSVEAITISQDAVSRIKAELAAIKKERERVAATALSDLELPSRQSTGDFIGGSDSSGEEAVSLEEGTEGDPYGRVAVLDGEVEGVYEEVDDLNKDVEGSRDNILWLARELRDLRKSNPDLKR